MKKLSFLFAIVAISVFLTTNEAQADPDDWFGELKVVGYQRMEYDMPQPNGTNTLIVQEPIYDCVGWWGFC